MLYSWTFLDNKNRGTLWYTITFSIVVGLVIWWFFTKQYWMSFIVMLLSWLMFYIDNNSKDEMNVEVWELGVKIWDSFHDYSKIKSYTFIYEWETAVLLRLILSKKWIKILDVNIDNTVAWELKHILPQFIEENEQEDLSFTDKMIRMLKL